MSARSASQEPGMWPTSFPNLAKLLHRPVVMPPPVSRGPSAPVLPLTPQRGNNISGKPTTPVISQSNAIRLHSSPAKYPELRSRSCEPPSAASRSLPPNQLTSSVTPAPPPPVARQTMAFAYAPRMTSTPPLAPYTLSVSQRVPPAREHASFSAEIVANNPAPVVQRASERTSVGYSTSTLGSVPAPRPEEPLCESMGLATQEWLNVQPSCHSMGSSTPIPCESASPAPARRESYAATETVPQLSESQVQTEQYSVPTPPLRPSLSCAGTSPTPPCYIPDPRAGCAPRRCVASQTDFAVVLLRPRAPDIAHGGRGSLELARQRTAAEVSVPADLDFAQLLTTYGPDGVATLALQLSGVGQGPDPDPVGSQPPAPLNTSALGLSELSTAPARRPEPPVAVDPECEVMVAVADTRAESEVEASHEISAGQLTLDEVVDPLVSEASLPADGALLDAERAVDAFMSRLSRITATTATLERDFLKAIADPGKLEHRSRKSASRRRT